MPRKKRIIAKKETLPDARYNSALVQKIINCIMIQGKKATAEQIVYGAMGIIEKQGKDPLATLKAAIEAIKPLLELKTRRIGGANYQIPVEVAPDRKLSLAIRWFITAVRERKERTMEQKMAQEILAAVAGQGGAMKKREDIHKMADANKAFAHYRW
ncbi:MAG: 30S ribosomal protein S7 [Spirochaetia bacterium]|nr:30S ribosomal protein S7 [Spirochaetia bacterium]